MSIQNKVIHVEFHAGLYKDQHHYFGSIAAIFEVFGVSDTGIGKQGLWQFNIAPNHPFTNKHCTIRSGVIVRKTGNRKPPVKVLRVIG